MGQEIDELFNTPEGCDLVVENVDGRIEITGWDTPQTRVVAVKHSDRPRVEITQDGRKVIARTHLEHGFLNWFKSNGAVDYTIYVPHQSNVKVRHVNGPTHIVQIDGFLDLDGVNGSIYAGQIDGKVQIHTVSGSVSVEALCGSAQLNAVNGKLEVKESALRSLSGETVNGEIQIHATLNPEGHYHLKTVNGSCILSVQDNLYARVSANGINMSVSTSLPTQSVEKHFGHWRGIIGSGDGPQAEICFETVNGSLQINNGHQIDVGVPSAPPTPPTPDFEPITVKVEGKTSPQGPKTKTEVLEMIERGEITVEEALKLLEKL